VDVSEFAVKVLDNAHLTVKHCDIVIAETAKLNNDKLEGGIIPTSLINNSTALVKIKHKATQLWNKYNKSRLNVSDKRTYFTVMDVAKLNGYNEQTKAMNNYLDSVEAKLCLPSRKKTIPLS